MCNVIYCKYFTVLKHSPSLLSMKIVKFLISENIQVMIITLI